MTAHRIADPLDRWENATAAEHDEHRAECDEYCWWCSPHRAVGICTDCGNDREADDAGNSACCGAEVVFPAPENDDLRWDQ